MSCSLTIGRLFGTAIRLHVTFLLFLLAIGGVTWAERRPGAAASIVTGLAGRLLYADLLLVLFNLIPAFTMDGGRVLRALLSLWRGPARGTRIAARLGQGSAVLIGRLGLVSDTIVLVGVFIYVAALAEEASLVPRAVAPATRRHAGDHRRPRGAHRRCRPWRAKHVRRRAGPRRHLKPTGSAAPVAGGRGARGTRPPRPLSIGTEVESSVIDALSRPWPSESRSSGHPARAGWSCASPVWVLGRRARSGTGRGAWPG